MDIKIGGGNVDGQMAILNRATQELKRDPLFGDAVIVDVWLEGDVFWARLDFTPNMGDRRDVDPRNFKSPGRNSRAMFLKAEAALEKALGKKVLVESRMTPSKNFDPPRPHSVGPGLGKLSPTKADWFDFYSKHPYIMEFSYVVPPQKQAGETMNDTTLRSKLAKIANDHPETRQYLVPLLTKEAGTVIAPDKLPKPSPWNVPIPWEDAREMIAANINALIGAGASLRKIKPLAADYALFVYRGEMFSLGVGRRMTGVTGNLFTETDDVAAVASRMSSLVGKIKQIAISEPADVPMKQLIQMVKPLSKNRWSLLLMAGIAKSMLEKQGILVPSTPAELEEAETSLESPIV